MQLINVLEGGKLIQDLGVEGNDVHRKIEIDKQHPVSIDEKSLLFEIAAEKSGSVNSAHHQGVDKKVLSNALQANAYSVNSVDLIEGLEFKDKTNKPFMISVQWHPERIIDKEVNPLSQNIKERFLSEIRKTF
jgi:putative glutamine amidotransferase